MADREEFQKKLAELLAKAAAQGNRMTQEELAAFFRDENLTEEQMEHIWDSFYTTSQKKKPVTSENEVRNIGLGLFVVRKIVNKHKGSCGVQNMENGVLFWLQLPEIRDLGK